MIHAEEIRKIVCIQRTVIYEKKTTRYDVGNPDLGLGHEQKSGGAKPENDIPTLCLNFTSDCVRHVDV
jgi:hypothetical protein